MKRCVVSSNFKYTLLIIIYSMTFLFLYLNKILQYRFPTEVTAQNVRTLEKDQYVRITMDQYLVEEVGDRGSYLDSGEAYVDFMVCIGYSAYLPVKIQDRELLSVLSTYTHGQGDQISFVGKVVKQEYPSGVNYVRYLFYESFDITKLVKDTYVYQLDENEVRSDHKYLLFLGGIGMTVALLMFFTIGGIHTTYERPFEETERYKEYVSGRIYDWEDELRKEKITLEELRQEQREAKKRILPGTGLFVGGILIGIYFEHLRLNFDVCTYIVINIVCLGADRLWYAFINSELFLANKISELFSIRSCSVRIEESIKIINAIKKRLWENREKEQEIPDDKMGDDRGSGQRKAMSKEDLSWLLQDD